MMDRLVADLETQTKDPTYFACSGLFLFENFFLFNFLVNGTAPLRK